MTRPDKAHQNTHGTAQGNAGNLHTVIGVFLDSDGAEEGLVALRDAGYPKEDLSLVFSNSEAAHEVTSQAAANRAGDTATEGLVIGGVAGGVVTGMIGAGLLVIPGAGLLLAAGWLASAAGGAAVGAAAGGWLGAITGIGVPEDVAHRYEREMSQGGWLVMALAAQGQSEELAKDILTSTGSRAVDSYAYQVRTGEFPGSESPYEEQPPA